MNKLSNIKMSEYNVYFFVPEENYTFEFNISQITYQSRVDIKRRVYYSNDETDIFPTINELLKQGKIREMKYVEEYTINLSKEYPCVPMFVRSKHLKNFPYEKVIADFAEHGIKISKNGLSFIVHAWNSGCKAGYKGKGYHLFVPSGDLNPLLITATKTLSRFSTWQKTYVI